MDEADHTRLIAGRYRTERLLGRGAMGDVWEAEDTLLGRRVALKSLHADLRRDPSLVERFTREGRALAGLHHPGIVAVYDLLLPDDGAPCMVMELVRGRSLAQVIADHAPLRWDVCARIGAETLEALHAAHTAGIVHRDVKPGNILIADPDGEVRVADFGVARMVDSSMTQSNMLIGTPAYMAPEQVTGDPVGPAADVYSLCCVLFEMACGRPPFSAREASAMTNAMMHVAQPVPDPRAFRPDLPDAAAAFIMRGLAKQPGERFADAASAARALRTAGHLPPPPPAPVAVPPPAPRVAAPAPVDADHDTAPSGGGSQHPTVARPDPTQLSPKAEGDKRKVNAGLIAGIAGAVVLAGAAVAGVLMVRGDDAPRGAASTTNSAAAPAGPETVPSTTPTASPATAAAAPARKVTARLTLDRAFVDPDPRNDPRDVCFGPGPHNGSPATIDVQGMRYRRNIVQCGSSVGGARAANGRYLFRGAALGLRNGVKVTGLDGEFVIDERGGAQQGARVAWTVTVGGRPLCEVETTFGAPGRCDVASPITLTGPANLVITQRVIEADDGASLWAGIHQGRLVIRRPEGQGPPARELKAEAPEPVPVTTEQAPVAPPPAPAPSSPAPIPSAGEVNARLDAQYRAMQAGDFYGAQAADAEALYSALSGTSHPLRGNSAYNAGVFRYAAGNCSAAVGAFAESVDAPGSSAQIAKRRIFLRAAEDGCVDDVAAVLSR